MPARPVRLSSPRLRVDLVPRPPCARIQELPVGFLLFLTLMFMAAGCSPGEKGGTGAASKTARPPAPVTVAQAVQKAVPVELRAVGQVEASSSVTVRSQVSGVVSAVDFREGQDVQEGTLLFTLDRRPFETLLARAEADLEQNRVALKQAERDSERTDHLLGSGLVSPEDAEAVHTRTATLRAAVAAGLANVEHARLQLDYCSIRAPQAGRTGEVRVRPGTVVKANDAPDLVTINTLKPAWVTFSLPEGNLPAIRRHMGTGSLEVRAVPPGDGLPPAKGRISFLDNTVDPATGTIRMKGTFANTDGRLWPGQLVEVDVVLETLGHAIVVPGAAVQTGQQGTYVFAVGPDGTAEVRPVTVGLTTGNEAVIESGLTAGETVVTEGQQRLFAGARVQVRQRTDSEQATQP